MTAPLSKSPPLGKEAQRAQLRQARKAYVQSLSPSARAAAERDLLQHLLPHLPKGARIALYRAVGEEIDATALAAYAAEQQWRLALPRVSGQGLMDFHLWEKDTVLEKGLASIPQPPAHAPRLMPDIILLPLVGADRHGHRLGQGAGYYDRALAALHSAGQRPFTIGLAWDVQVGAPLAHEPHDVPLDALCTPTQWILCAHGGDAAPQIV